MAQNIRSAFSVQNKVFLLREWYWVSKVLETSPYLDRVSRYTNVVVLVFGAFVVLVFFVLFSYNEFFLK